MTSVLGYIFIDNNYSKSSLEVQWLMTHGFFITMGGFHLFECSSEEMSNNG